ncbi:superantigen-like protein SSL4 [Lysobacter claricitrinus]|uniref:hypothetical protein n=1 Tax=Lysobacter claricitrinus TaxID=3367728 RepID=UPI0037DADDED
MTSQQSDHHPRRQLARTALALAVTLWTATACHPATPPVESSTAANTAKANDASSTPASAAPSTDDATPPATSTPGETPTPPPSNGGDASLPEPTTPPDVASPQAAATVVETYFALIDEKRTQEADALWSDAARAAAFRDALDKLGKPHMQVFAPGGIEGAAGSMYITVPVEFGATDQGANSRPRKGEVTLRRVNDVPGSTEAQRHWHIDHIDVAMTPK